MIDLSNVTSLNIDGNDLVSLSIDDNEIWRANTDGEPIDLESIGYNMDSKYSLDNGSLVDAPGYIAINKIDIDREPGELVRILINCKKIYGAKGEENTGTLVMYRDSTVLHTFQLYYNDMANPTGSFQRYGYDLYTAGHPGVNGTCGSITIYDSHDLNWEPGIDQATAFAISFYNNTIEDISMSILRGRLTT